MLKKVLGLLSVSAMMLLVASPAHALVTPGGVAKLSVGTITPASNDVGDTFTAKIMLDTGGVAADGATVKLSYDPTKLNCTHAVSGSLFGSEDMTSSIDATAGVFDDDFVPTDIAGVNGHSVELLTLTFTVLPTTSATITFDQTNCSVLDVASGNEILGSALSKTINFGSEATATATTTTSPLNPTGPAESGMMAAVVSLVGVGGFFAFRRFNRIWKQL